MAFGHPLTAASCSVKKYVKVNQVLLELRDKLKTDLWTLDAIWWYLDESKSRPTAVATNARITKSDSGPVRPRVEKIAPADESISADALSEIRALLVKISAQLSTMRASNTVKTEISIDISQIETEVERPTPSRSLLKSFLERLQERLQDHLAKAVDAGVTAALGILGGILAKYFGF